MDAKNAICNGSNRASGSDQAFPHSLCTKLSGGWEWERDGEGRGDDDSVCLTMGVYCIETGGPLESAWLRWLASFTWRHCSGALEAFSRSCDIVRFNFLGCVTRSFLHRAASFVFFPSEPNIYIESMHFESWILLMQRK